MVLDLQPTKYGIYGRTFWRFGSELINVPTLRAYDMAGLVKWRQGDTPIPVMHPHEGIRHDFMTEKEADEAWHQMKLVLTKRRSQAATKE